MDFKKQFFEDWVWTRGLTLKFVETIPEDKFNFSPGGNFGHLGKQLRHIGAVQECYLVGFETGKIDFSKKIKDVSLEKSKIQLVKYFTKLDNRFENWFKTLDIKDLDRVINWKVWEDLPNPTISQALYYMLEHEIFHQGILQLYAELAGFETIRFF
ncbi:MAG: DinB family protein [Nanoarchaeota archaeon]